MRISGLTGEAMGQIVSLRKQEYLEYLQCDEWKAFRKRITAIRGRRMKKLPAMQFYTGDWMKDPNLARCSYGAKGLLMDLLCVCHEHNPRGLLCEDDGVTPWSDEDVLRACRCYDHREGIYLLHELLTKNVLSRNETGCIYNRRMVRDEELRALRAECGKKGAKGRWGNNSGGGSQTDGKSDSKTDSKTDAEDMANAMAKGMRNDGSSSSSSSSSSDNNKSATRSSCRRKKFCDADFTLAQFIFARIQDLNPANKLPNFETWANDIRLMRERDQRTHDEIKALFTWANNDEFWQTNILCPSTLRKQWDQLTIKRRGQAHGKGHQSSGAGWQAEIDRAIIEQGVDSGDIH